MLSENFCKSLVRKQRLDLNSKNSNKQVWQVICKDNEERLIEIYYSEQNPELEILLNFLSGLKDEKKEKFIKESVFLPDFILLRKRGISTYYKVAEFGDLKSFVKYRDKELSYFQKEDLARKFTKALLNFYKLGYFHGDLKPSNIVVFKVYSKEFLDLRFIDLEHIFPIEERKVNKVGGTPGYKYSHKQLRLCSACDELFSILAVYFFIFSSGKRLISVEKWEELWKSKPKNMESLKDIKQELDKIAEERIKKHIKELFFRKLLLYILNELRRETLNCDVLSVIKKLDMLLISKLRPIYRLLILK